MKKILSIFMIVAMLLSMSIAAFAASSDFLESPSNKRAPELIEYEQEDPNCTGKITVISYGDRDKLNDDEKKEFEDAYDDIINADDLKDLNSKLDDDNLAVSDLFGIDLNGCDDHTDHGNTHIKLDADTADNFDSLIAYDGEKWVVVDATVSGDVLSFSAKLDGFTAFAIIVKTASDAPQTGDTFSWVYVALMVASATGFVAVCISMRKKKD